MGPPRIIGRYALFDRIAAGGMATVHLGRLLGPVGFARTVAIKRLHPHFAEDPEFVSMFLDEARVAARIRHPNVVPTLDVVSEGSELFLVMEYVQGESLARLIKSALQAGERIPAPISVSILAGVLFGLHAAHEAQNEQGVPLGIVHRDVSPQNILVGTDGTARVLDFGVAKAVGRLQTTREGQLKGKIAYMAPEQIHGRVTRQTDVYAAAVVLWEALTGTRLFTGDSEGEVVNKILSLPVPPPSKIAKEVPADFDRIVLRGLERDPAARYATAREMALELEMSGFSVPPFIVGEWVEKRAATELSRRAALVSRVEAAPIGGGPPPATRDGSSDLSERLPSETPTDVDPQFATGTEAHAVRTTSSVVSTPGLPRGRLGPRMMGAVLLLGAVVTGIILVRGRMQQTTNPTQELKPSPSSAPLAIDTTASATEAPPQTSVTEAPTTAPSPVSSAWAAANQTVPKIAPVPTAPDVASKKASGVPTSGILAKVPAKPEVKTVPRPPPNCDPPFEIINGKERLKAECRTR